MTNAQREVLAGEPVPVDEAGMPAQPCVTQELGSRTWRLAWLVGLKKRSFGPDFTNVREACAASRFLRDRALA